MLKKAAFLIGAIVLVFLGWRILRNLLNPPVVGPRQTMTRKQKFLDDNAPTAVYAMIVPPIAQNVTSNAGEVILRRNDSVLPALYTLPAMGPNGNS